jgi:hypothetical protein
VTSRVGKQLAGRMVKVEKSIKNAGRPAAAKAGGILQQSTARTIKSASGGDSRLSGVGRKGAKVGSRYVVSSEPNGDATAVVRATGPLHFIENDTKAGARYRRRRGRGGAAGPTKPMMHPGTKGQRPFERGIAAGRPAAVKALRSAFTDAVRKGFR